MTTVAVAGTGRIAREHIAALTAVPGVRVGHVVGSDHDRAEAVAALAPGASATTDLGEVLADRSVDGVDVCGATPEHARVAVRAADAGKHLLIEKPVALDLAELARIERAVDVNGVHLLVGQTVRFQPAVTAVARAVTVGEVGDVRLLRIGWYTGYVWPQGWRGWQLDPARSGGHPVHNGTHAFDLAVWLLAGRTPRRVFVRQFRTFSPDVPVPDSFHATVRFDDDSLVLVELCYALRRHGDSLRRLLVIGERGTLTHTDDGWSGLHSAASIPPSAGVTDAMHHQMAHWVSVLRGESEPSTTSAQVRSALATAVAAQRSLESGRAEEVRLDG